MTKEAYNEAQPHRATIELFISSGQWVGSNDLFTIIEKHYSTTIDRSCNDCKSGFLKFINSEIKNYEKNLLNNSASAIN